MRFSACGALFLCAVAQASTTTLELPMAFEARGPQYVARGAGYATNIAADKATLQWDGHAVQMQLVGADSRARMEGLGRMPGHATYLLGTTKGLTYDLYGQVVSYGVYPGIDVLYRGDRQRLEYDFHLAPHANAGAISLSFNGVDRVEIDSSGDLILQAGTRTIRQPKPLAWQIVAGVRRDIAVEYRKLAGGRIGLRLAEYDSALPLVIDPAIIFDTAFGGAGGSVVQGVTLDKQGNIYVAGSTSSANFATVNPVQKQLGTAPMLTSTDGGKTWSAESLGPATSINTVVAAPGSPSTLYANSFEGVFQSTDSGATWKQQANSGFTGSFVDISVDGGSPSSLYACNTKGIFLSADAGNSWQPSNNGIDVYTGATNAQCFAIRAHPSKPGVVFYMAYNPSGLYRSVDFGKTWTALNPGPNAYSIQTIVFNPATPDTLIAAQMGGPPLVSTDDGDTWTATGVQSVGNNHAFVVDPNNPSVWYMANGAGVSRSTDAGKTWAVVLPPPSQAYSNTTVLAIDSAHVYAFDPQGLFISSDGQTWSMAATPYAVAPGSLYVAPDGSRILLGTQSAGDVFVTKWDPSGTQILYSTYLGGSGGDSASGIAVDSAGSAYVIGTTASSNFPVTANALQKALVGGHDVFVAKLSPDGSTLVYSTLFGGGNEFASALAVDSTGAVFFTGSVTGGLPVSSNAFQKSPGAPTCSVPSSFLNYPPTGDSFIAKISPDGASLTFASYLGGACGDQASDIAVNTDGSAWVVGTTFSPDFPTTTGALQPNYGGGFGDGYLARISATGALTYATYIGGSDYDQIDALTLDSSGNIYLTGSSAGFSQPATAGAFQPTVSAGCFYLGFGIPLFHPDGNAFVLKMNPTATAVSGLTYIGTPCSADGTKIALDGAGAVWIAGIPSSIFPTAIPLRIQSGDSFLSKFSPDLTQLLFSTYFDAIGGLAIDQSGMAVVAGSAGVQAYVAKVDPAPAAISLNNVASASPFYASAMPLSTVWIAPGKVIRLVGKGMGPLAQTAGIVTGGAIATQVAGVQVTFDGIPGPLLYVSTGEIECVVPFEVTGQAMTTVQVTYNGAKSNGMAVPVHASATEVLSVLNADFTVNSPTNPAEPGSIMTLYITGTGQTNPASTTGQIYGGSLPLPAGSVTIFNTGVQLPVTYAAAAYGLAAGIVQVNFQAPATNPQSVVSATANGSFGYFTLTVK